MATRSTIGLELGHGAVKLVEYSHAKKEIITIAKLFVKPEEWGAPQELYKKISQWVIEKKQSSQVEVALGLNARRGVVRSVKVPREETDLKKYIQWEAEQYTLPENEDIVVQFSKLGPANGEVMEDYVYSSFPRSSLETMVKIFQKHSLPLTIVDVDLFAAYNAVEVNYPDIMDQPFLLFKMDSDCLSCVYLKQGLWKRLDYITVPEGYVEAEGEEKQTGIRQMLVALVSFYKLCDPEDSPKKIVVCGDLSTDPAFLEEGKKLLPVDWVLLDSFKNVSFPHEPEFEKKVRETAPQCAVALGLSLRSSGETL